MSTSLRRGFLIGTEGDCAPAKFDDSGDFDWHNGGFDTGETRRCTVTMLTRRNAAGTFANVVTEIRVLPSGYSPRRGRRRTQESRPIRMRFASAPC